MAYDEHADEERPRLRVIPGQLDIYGRPDPARNMPGRLHAAGGDTEQGAAELVTPRTGTQRARVLERLQHLGEHGSTDYELWAVFGIGARPHVAGTRREELIADGWPIIDSGRRRLTDTGTPAIVWRLEDG